jgi:hypothetical protein
MRTSLGVFASVVLPRPLSPALSSTRSLRASKEFEARRDLALENVKGTILEFLTERGQNVLLYSLL